MAHFLKIHTHTPTGTGKEPRPRESSPQGRQAPGLQRPGLRVLPRVSRLPSPIPLGRAIHRGHGGSETESEPQMKVPVMDPVMLHKVRRGKSNQKVTKGTKLLYFRRRAEKQPLMGVGQMAPKREVGQPF